MNYRVIEIEETNFLIRMAVAHHITTDGIEDRTYSMTIKLEENTNIDKLLKPIFIKSNFTLYQRASGFGSRRSSMILCADVAGTRTFQGNFRRHELPHIHGLWILSPEDHSQLTEHEIDPVPEFKKKLLCLKEIARDRSAIEIKKIDGGMSGLRRYASYATKAPRQADRVKAFLPSARVFPYEIECSKASEQEKILLHNRRDSLQCLNSAQ